MDYLEKKDYYDSLGEKAGCIQEPLMLITSISLANWNTAVCVLNLRFWMKKIIRVVQLLTITDRQTPHTRIIEHKHFEFGTQPKTVITREYPVTWEEGMEPYYPVNDEKNQELYPEIRKTGWKRRKMLFRQSFGERNTMRYGLKWIALAMRNRGKRNLFGNKTVKT